MSRREPLQSYISQIYALSRFADVKFYGPGFPNCPRIEDLDWKTPLDVPSIIHNLYGTDYPDAVIQSNPYYNIFRGGEGMWPALKNFELAKCLRVIWIHDLQNTIPPGCGAGGSGMVSLLECIQQRKVDLVIKYWDINNETVWSKNLASTGVPVECCHFSIDPQVFFDRKLPKIYDVANIGVKDPTAYPLRRKIHEVLCRQAQIRYFPQEGDSCEGDTYVRIINQSKIFATCASRFIAPMQKMFEAMACNTLLMCNMPRDGKELGFEPNVNFGLIDDYPSDPRDEVKIEKFMEPIRFYLSHLDEAKEIAQRGHDLVHSRHTHGIRMKELVTKLSRYLS